MTINNQKKLAKHIFRLLKVTDLIVPIGRTNKGNFGLRFNADSEDFEMYLDAVPLSTRDVLNDENNIELKTILEKYLFEDVKQYIPVAAPYTNMTTSAKRGRPAGSKNKK